MDQYAALAEEFIQAMDQHRHNKPEPVSGAMRGEIAVLKLLFCAKQSLSAGYISRELDMTTSRIAAVLNSLEKKHMIERVGDAQDRRRVLVSITACGIDYCVSRREEAVSHMTALLTRLGEEDARSFVRIIKRMFEALPEINKEFSMCAAEKGDKS